MTDTFILQLPDIDDKVYYIPGFKHYETPITTLNIDGAITNENKGNSNNNDSSCSSCSDSNSSNLLSNTESFYYGFDYYDVESVYDSYGGSITNTTTKIKNTNLTTSHNNNNNNNNLFYDKNFTLESSLNLETHFKIFPSYIQNSFESNCTSISTKKYQSQIQPIIESLTPSSEYCPQQFTILSPTPLRSNDIYCPLLHTENLTYEQYLTSNEFNIEKKNIITKDCQDDNGYDFNYYYYYSKNCLKRSKNKRKNEKRDRKYKKKYLDILSTFSNYSSLFSKNDQKNTKIKKDLYHDKNKDYQNYIENNEKNSHNNIIEQKSTLKELELQNNNKNVSNGVNKNLDYCSFDFNFITIIENKLNRYTTNTLDRVVSSNSKTSESSLYNADQDILDKIRLQEVSYRFSKSYF